MGTKLLKFHEIDHIFCHVWFSTNSLQRISKKTSRRWLRKITISITKSYSYYRGIYSAKHLQILQNVGWFSVSISSGNVQIFVLNVTFKRYMMKVSCGNTEFKHQNQNKTFQDSQGRAALFASPFLQNLKCKFPQYFHILIGISPKLR